MSVNYTAQPNKQNFWRPWEKSKWLCHCAKTFDTVTDLVKHGLAEHESMPHQDWTLIMPMNKMPQTEKSNNAYPTVINKQGVPSYIEINGQKFRTSPTLTKSRNLSAIKRLPSNSCNQVPTDASNITKFDPTNSSNENIKIKISPSSIRKFKANICPYCQKQFSSQRGVANHTRFCQMIDQPIDYKSYLSKIKKDNVFAVKTVMENGTHVAKQLSDHEANENRYPWYSASKPNHACQFCIEIDPLNSEKFNTIEQMREHQKLMHSIYRCEICQIVYSTKEQKEEHEDTWHMGGFTKFETPKNDKLLSCPNCEKRFHRLTTLETHYQLKHAEKCK